MRGGRTLRGINAPPIQARVLTGVDKDMSNEAFLEKFHTCYYCENARTDFVFVSWKITPQMVCMLTNTRHGRKYGKSVKTGTVAILIVPEKTRRKEMFDLPIGKALVAEDAYKVRQLTMPDEIDKVCYCTGDKIECEYEGGGGDCGDCPYCHRKWPTPEQYKAEYGRDWPDNAAVYFVMPQNDREEWGLGHYKFIRNVAPFTPIVCACTPWGMPPDNWRPE
jgi:hypothetical protein